MSAPIVKLAAEGGIDIAVLRRLVRNVGLEAGAEYGLKGKSHLDRQLNGYNAAASREPWLVARDLDDDAPCPGELAIRLLPAPADLMRFRIAVRTVESWLIADHVAFGSVFGVSTTVLPKSPEALVDPKASTLAVLATSKFKDIRSSMVRLRSGRPTDIGPEYNVRFIDYVEHRWRPAEAAKLARSLGRAINRVADLAPIARSRWAAPFDKA